MRIKIEYKSQTESINILVETDDEIFTCNGRNVLTPIFPFKEKLLDIIFNWKNELINPNIKDAESYKIFITTEDDTFTFIGQGIYPDNFAEFRKLILEVANG